MDVARSRIGSIEELKRARALKFSFSEEGIPREGFLLWFGDQVIAYENRCRHIPLSLDYGDGRFLSADGKMIVCQTHGAVYEPLTGECTAGPCPGAFLRKLPIEAGPNGEIFLVQTNEK